MFLSFMATKVSASFVDLPSRGEEKKAVLPGFWYGNNFVDADYYLARVTNKQIGHKIFNTLDEIDIKAVVQLLKEAVITGTPRIQRK